MSNEPHLPIVSASENLQIVLDSLKQEISVGSLDSHDVLAAIAPSLQQTFDTLAGTCSVLAAADPYGINRDYLELSVQSLEKMRAQWKMIAVNSQCSGLH